MDGVTCRVIHTKRMHVTSAQWTPTSSRLHLGVVVFSGSPLGDLDLATPPTLVLEFCCSSRSGNDSDTQPFDCFRICVCETLVSDKRVDQVEAAEPREGIPVHLCGVGDEIDLS